MADDTRSSRSSEGGGSIPADDDDIEGLGEDVFAASRDGDLSRLRSLLVDSRSKDELQRVVCRNVNGASSLIMACRNGHAAVVSFLVTRCHADVEQVGSVTFDGEVRWMCSVRLRSVETLHRTNRP